MNKLRYIGAFLILHLVSTRVNCGPPLQLESLSGPSDDDDTQASFQLNGVRLPRNFWPLHYDLEIRPILNLPESDPQQFTAPGKVTIRIRCDNATDSITLHAAEINIQHDDIVLTSIQTGLPLTMIQHAEDITTSTYKMTFSTTIAAQQEYDLYIPFTSLVGNRLEGLYRSSYLDSAGTRKWLATTQFQKTGARLAFPCFDEPNFRSTFNITVGRHINFHSLSNAALESTTFIPGMLNWEWDIYEKSVNMPAYLIAIIVSDFNSVEAPTELSNYLVKTWGPPSMTNDTTGEFSARAAAQILTYFENYYDYPYQISKLDSVAVPDFEAGAMENWGLNTYRLNLMLWFEASSTQFEQWRQAAVIAHEISHHWFGDLVTCDWWNDLWIQEGFARYMQFLGANASLTQHGVMDRYTLDVIQIAMENDAGPNTEPLHSNVTDQVVNQNSRIVYEKGAAVIRMMQAFLTENTLINGLRSYLKKFAYANAVQDDLFAELQIQAEFDGNSAPFTVKEIMDSWTLKSGFPVVRVGRASLNLIYVSQEPFVNLDQRQTQQNGDELWYVPITYATKNNPDFSDSNWQPKFWLDKYTLSTTRAIENTTEQWIIFNPDARSYYRVLYDAHFERLIQEQLLADHTVISLSSRSQLIDDYFKSAFQGYISLDKALEFTRYLHNEVENTVWTTVLNNLRQPYRLMQDNPGLDLLRDHISEKVTATLDTIGWTQLDTDLPVTIILRSQLLDWASTLGIAELETVANDYIQALAEFGTPIPADIQPAIFCKAISQADRFPTPNFDIRQHVLEQYKAATRPERQTIFINALACESVPARINALVTNALADRATSDFTVTHATQLLQRLVETPENRASLLDELFMLQINNFLTNLGESAASSVISSFVSYTTDETLGAEIKGRITALISLVTSETVKESLRNSGLQLDKNAVWDQTFGESIGDWLPSTTTPTTIATTTGPTTTTPTTTTPTTTPPTTVETTTVDTTTVDTTTVDTTTVDTTTVDTTTVDTTTVDTTTVETTTVDTTTVDTTTVDTTTVDTTTVDTTTVDTTTVDTTTVDTTTVDTTTVDTTTVDTTTVDTTTVDTTTVDTTTVDTTTVYTTTVDTTTVEPEPVP